MGAYSYNRKEKVPALDAGTFLIMFENDQKLRWARRLNDAVC